MNKLRYFIKTLVIISFLIICIGVTSNVLLHNDSIPSTLEECYTALDFNLYQEDKNNIRDAGNGNLYRLVSYRLDLWDELVAKGLDPVLLDLDAANFGLGMWIRNNWIYKSPHSNIAYKFLLAGVMHPDDMSHFILMGYHLYLNNLPYKIPIQPRAIAAYAVIALIFASSLAYMIACPAKLHKQINRPSIFNLLHYY